jgi:hypothetical protein
VVKNGKKRQAYFGILNLVQRAATFAQYIAAHLFCGITAVTTGIPSSTLKRLYKKINCLNFVG